MFVILLCIFDGYNLDVSLDIIIYYNKYQIHKLITNNY